MADPTPPAGDPLALLASLPASPFLVRLSSLPRSLGWRLELSEDDGGSWSSLEAGKPGQATPAAAIVEGTRLIGEWQGAREESHSAEIAHYFTSGRLQRSKIVTQDEEGNSIEIDGFIATSEDGSKFEAANPLEAIKKEKESKVKPSMKGSPT
jgi:hypothetical protein